MAVLDILLSLLLTNSALRKRIEKEKENGVYTHSCAIKMHKSKRSKRLIKHMDEARLERASWHAAFDAYLSHTNHAVSVGLPLFHIP